MTLAFALVFTACSSCNEPSGEGAPSASVGAPLDSVPEPKGILAEWVIREPDATWKNVRQLVGGPAALLPATSGMFVGTLLGLPGRVASAVDGDVPIVGVLLDTPERSAERAALVFGVHVRSGNDLVADLTTGQKAEFSVRRDEPSRVRVLRRTDDRIRDFALGVVGNYLVAASNEPALLLAGPYVARNLPKKPVPKVPVVLLAYQQALSGSIPDFFKAAWSAYKERLEKSDRDNRLRHGGRAPDFGDPLVAIESMGGAVDSFVSILAESKEIRVVAEPLGHRLQAHAELTPAGPGAAKDLVDSMTVGDLRPLLELPRSSSLAVLTRSTKKERLASAESAGKGLSRLFSDRLAGADRKASADALAALAEARGDYLLYALVDDPPMALVTGPAVDEKKLDQGIDGLIGLLNSRAFAEPLRQFLGKVKTRRSKASVKGVDSSVRKVDVELEPSALRLGLPGARPGLRIELSFEILWTVKEGLFALAAAAEAEAALAEVMNGTSTGLSKSVFFSDAVHRAGSEATFALVMRPGELGMGDGSAGASPLILSLGRKGGKGVVHFDADGEALRAVFSELGEP